MTTATVTDKELAQLKADLATLARLLTRTHGQRPELLAIIERGEADLETRPSQPPERREAVRA